MFLFGDIYVLYFFWFIIYFRNIFIVKGFNKIVSFENDMLYKKCFVDCLFFIKIFLYEGLIMIDVLGDLKCLLEEMSLIFICKISLFICIYIVKIILSMIIYLYYF